MSKLTSYIAGISILLGSLGCATVDKQTSDQSKSYDLSWPTITYSTTRGPETVQTHLTHIENDNEKADYLDTSTRKFACVYVDRGCDGRVDVIEQGDVRLKKLIRGKDSGLEGMFVSADHILGAVKQSLAAGNYPNVVRTNL